MIKTHQVYSNDSKSGFDVTTTSKEHFSCFVTQKIIEICVMYSLFTISKCILPTQNYVS